MPLEPTLAWLLSAAALTCTVLLARLCLIIAAYEGER